MLPTTRSPWFMAVTALTICGVVTAVVYLKGVRPVFLQSSVAAEAEASLRRYREKYQGVQGSKQAICAELDQVQQSLQASPLLLKAAPRRNFLFAQIAKMAVEAGITLNKLTPDEPFQTTRYEVIPVLLEAKADFPTCVRFIHSLCGRFPDVGVTGIDLGSDPANPRSTVLQLKIEWYASPGR